MTTEPSLQDSIELTFVDKCMCGDAFVDEIHHYIQKWIDSPVSIGLARFLGMTQKEWNMFCANVALVDILQARCASVSNSDSSLTEIFNMCMVYLFSEYFYSS